MCIAGISPKTQAVASDSNSANTNTRPSTAIWLFASNDGFSANTVGSAQAAARTPRLPPHSASRPLSATSWRISRLRLAPNAERMEISVRRVSDRASNKLATLAQAMIRTSATAPASSCNPGRSPPTVISYSER